MFRLAHSEINSGHCSEVKDSLNQQEEDKTGAQLGKGPFTSWSLGVKDRAGRGGLPPGCACSQRGAGGLSRSGDSKKRTHEGGLTQHSFVGCCKARGGHHHTPGCKGQWLGRAADADRAPQDNSVPLNWSIPGTLTDTPGLPARLWLFPGTPRPQPQQHRAGVGSPGRKPTTPVQGPCEMPSRLGGQWP